MVRLRPVDALWFGAMASKVFSVKFDEGLMARVDEAAESAGVSRSVYIRGVLEGALGGITGAGGITAVEVPVVPVRESKGPRKYTPEELVVRRARHEFAFGCELANFQDRDERDADRVRKLLGEDR